MKLKMKLLKKTMYDKFVTKVNNIDTRGFALKTRYYIDKLYLEKKISDADKNIPDTSGLIMLKFLKQKVKYRVLVFQLLLLLH